MQRRSVWPRVLLVCPDAPDGEDSRSWHECHALVAAGYEVAVVAPPTGVRLKGVRYYPRRPRRGPLAGTRTWVATWVLCLRALVGHGFSLLQWSGPPHGLWAVAAPYRLLGKKLVYDQRDAPADGDARGWRRAMERANAGVAHRVIVSTSVLASRTPRRRLQWRVGAPDYIRTFDDLVGIPEYGAVVVLLRSGAADGAPRYVVRPDARRAARRQVQRRQQGEPLRGAERRHLVTRRESDRRVAVATAADWGAPAPRRETQGRVGAS